MPEAEEVIGDAARHVAAWSMRAWRQIRGDDSVPCMELVAIRRRLELLVEALYGPGIAVRGANPPAPLSVIARFARRSDQRRGKQALPGTDGDSVFLPSRLPCASGELASREFRIMALQQAARCRRGTAAHYPFDQPPLTRALFLISEVAASDAWLAMLAPGFLAAVIEFRRGSHARRPRVASLASPEREVEELYQSLLALPPGERPRELPLAEGPKASAAWASSKARELGPRIGTHPGIWPDFYLGEILRPEAPSATMLLSGKEEPAWMLKQPPRANQLSRRPRARNAREHEDDGHEGIWMVQTSEPIEHAEDPMGLQRPTDREGDADPRGLSDSLAELPEARLVRSAQPVREVLLSSDPPTVQRPQPTPGGIEDRVLRYPEWDYRSRCHRHDAVAVHLAQPHEGSQEWVEKTLARYRVLLNQVRRRFHAIRSRRSVLPQQPEGDEIDLEAYVQSYAEVCAHLSPTDRLYQIHRPARRDLALLMLIDSSGSTDSWVSGQSRVIDIEKEALLVVSVALQALDMPYAILSFSGRGPESVSIRTLKPFEERYQARVGRRIAALEPEEFTRTGAAIRHGVEVSMRQTAFRRLLLVISDGKPNDVDQYDGRYGIEDTRQAVQEARGRGIEVFGLTVDRQAASYLPQLYGPGKYAILHRPERLSTALLDWLRHATLSLQ